MHVFRRHEKLLLVVAVIAAVALLCVGQTVPLSRDDIVVVFPIDEWHTPLARASRSWRKGLRTFIATNVKPSLELIEEGKKYNETWVFYPDDHPLRSLYAGDTRAALVPFLAHKEYGNTYKWMLYGDDDTIFFVDNVMRLLNDFNSSIPYFVTDHLWFTAKKKHAHPHPDAPRCLPCHFDLSTVNASSAIASFKPIKGCPCTPELLCKNDKKRSFNEYCDIPRAPKTLYSMHGGAGGLISVGLMNKLPWDYMEQCVRSLFSTGGDAFLTICLWQAGYAHTDPGLSFFRKDLQFFDPGPEDRLGMMTKLAKALDHRCDKECMDQLFHVMTLHVRSRMFPNLDDAGLFIKAVTGMFDNVVEMTKYKDKFLEARQAAEAKMLAKADAKADAVAVGKAAGVGGV